MAKTLFTAEDSDGASPTLRWEGGGGLIAAYGTFDAASVLVQWSPDNGTTWFDIATVLEEGVTQFNIPGSVAVRGTISSAGGSTSVSVQLFETDEAVGAGSSGGGGGLTAVGQYLSSPPDLADAETTALRTNIKGYAQVIILDGNLNPLAYPAAGHIFSVAIVPTVTNGAYAPGDIMGGLLTFSGLGAAIDAGFIITGAQVIFKSAVIPNPLMLVLFNADPTSTTKTDNAVYSLNAADAFKVIATIPFQTLGAQHTDHGTPNSIRIDGLNISELPASGTDDLFGLLIDGSGVTLTSTSDVQIRLRGPGG